MIKNLRTYADELVLLGQEMKVSQEGTEVEMELAIGENGGESELFTLHASYNIDENVLYFEQADMWHGLSKPEKIILYCNVLEQLFFLPDTSEKIDEETKAAGEGEPKTLKAYQDAREQARRELTYFEKHQETREDIEQFIEWMGKSETTEKTYLYGLERFFEYLIVNTYDTYPKFDEEVIDQFVRTLQDEEKSVYYVNRLVTCIVSFSEFVAETDKMGCYLDKQINRKQLHVPEMPKLADMPPRTLDNERIVNAENYLLEKYAKAEFRMQNALFAAWGGGHRGAYRDAFRNLLLFRIILDGGLLISEALGLDFDDVQIRKTAEDSYFVIRKAKKERRVPIFSEALREDLQMYMKWRKENDVEVEWEKEMRHLQTNRKYMGEFLTDEQVQQVLDLNKEIKRLSSTKEEERKNTGEIMVLRFEELHILSENVREHVKKHFNQDAMKALFVSNRSKRVSANTIQVMFNELGKQKRKNEAGEWEAYNVGMYKVSANELRQTCIQNLVDLGAPADHIQLLLGHETSAMLTRYAKPNFEEMAKAIGKIQRNKK